MVLYQMANESFGACGWTRDSLSSIPPIPQGHKWGHWNTTLQANTVNCSENVMAENHWVGVPFSSPSLVVLCHKLPEEMAGGLANWISTKARKMALARIDNCRTERSLMWKWMFHPNSQDLFPKCLRKQAYLQISQLACSILTISAVNHPLMFGGCIGMFQIYSPSTINSSSDLQA